MAQVAVTVNGRSYTVACEDGDEDHLLDLARYFDKRAQELSATFGAAGDSRLFLIAGLTVVDDLVDALSRIEDLEAEIDRLKAGHKSADERVGRAEIMAAEVLEVAAQRLEDIAGRLKAS